MSNSPMTLSSLHPTTADNVQYSFYSELMKNYAPELPVDVNHTLKAIDENGTPLIFSIGMDNALYVIHPQNQSQTGWVQKNLSGTLGKVTAFNVYQSSSGSFRLGMAVTQSENSHCFYTSDLVTLADLDPASFNAAKFWKAISLPDPTAEVNQAYMASNMALIATTKPGQDALYYTISEKGQVKQYELPEDGSTVLQIALGTVYSNLGVFLLYKVGSNRTMLFESFPDPNYGGKTSKHRFEPGGVVNAFDLLRDEEGNDRLVTSGEGIFLFPDPDSSPQTIVPTSNKLTFEKIVSAQRDGKISLWVLGKDSGQQSALYLISNQFYNGSNDTVTPDKWTAPIAMQKETGQFACIRGDEIRNSLFLISEDNTLFHFWQDQTSTLWQQMPIPIYNTGKVREFDSYTLHVQFSCDELKKTFYEQKVKVWASAAIYVNINGQGYQLGPKTEAEVPLNVQGDLTLVNPVKSIAAPTVYIQAPFMTETLEIDLTHKVEERLQQVKSVDDLKNATKYDPKSNTQVPLLPHNAPQDSGTLNGVAHGVQQFLHASNHLKKKAKAPQQTYSLSFHKEGNVTYKEGSEARTHLTTMLGGNAADAAAPETLFSISSVLSDLGHDFGDVLHWMEGVADEVGEFVIHMVDDAAHFVIQIGEDIYKFILKTAEQVFAGLEWLFKKIYLFFKDLIEWIGFLFDWHDILVTKDVLKQFINNAFDGLERNVDRIKSEFDDWIDRVIKQDLHSPELVNRLKSQSDSLSGWHSKGKDTSIKPKADPRVNWANSKAHHISDLTASETNQTSGGTLSNLLESIEPVAKDFAIAYEKIGEELDGLIDGSLSIGDFAIKLLDTLGALALDILKAIVDAMLDGISALVEEMMKGLNASIDIPLLSELYKLISGGDPLTIIDLTCLLVAIPTTIIYKIEENKAPFSAVNKDEFTNLSDSFFSNFVFSNDRNNSSVEKTKDSIFDYVRDSASTQTPDTTFLAEETKSTLTILIQNAIAATRLTRIVTFSIRTIQAMSAEAPSRPGIVFLDSFIRIISVLFVGVNKKTERTDIAIIIYYIWLMIHGYEWAWEKKVLSIGSEKPLNLIRALDSSSVTVFGIWGAVETGINWNQKTSAQQAAEVAIEVFQIPAIVGYIANRAAKYSDATNVKVNALSILALRDASLVASFVSTEFVAF